MKWSRTLALSAAVYLFGSGATWTQDLEAELTITLIRDPAAELPIALTHEIALPETAADEGELNSADGLATANENRAEAAANRDGARVEAQQNGRAGLEIAADARERGEEIAEAARTSRADFVRGDAELDLPIPEDLPELPVDVSDVPARPGLPDAAEVPDLPDVAAGP